MSIQGQYRPAVDASAPVLALLDHLTLQVPTPNIFGVMIFPRIFMIVVTDATSPFGAMPSVTTIMKNVQYNIFPLNYLRIPYISHRYSPENQI